VIFLGINQTIEAEGQDRTETTLPGVQMSLVQNLTQVGTPIVVVLINGGTVSIEWIKDNVPAILEAWYPGENGARAIAEVLFGDYNPGGTQPDPSVQYL
jgi:beta-glucosidase